LQTCLQKNISGEDKVTKQESADLAFVNVAWRVVKMPVSAYQSKRSVSYPYSKPASGKILRKNFVLLIFCCTFEAKFKPQAYATHVLHISTRLGSASAPERRAGAVR